MFCPECKGEFIPGVTRCDTCDVPLVESLPEPEEAAPAPHPSTAPAAAPARSEADARPVTVLSTGDPGLMALAKSLLQAEGIPFFTRGEAGQDLFGLGRIGGFNVIVGPAVLLVRSMDAEDARALLEGIEDGVPVESEGRDAFGDDSDDEARDDDEPGAVGDDDSGGAAAGG
jgi:hypothetical protein